MTPRPWDPPDESASDDRRCPYCHETVPAQRYRRHVAKHEERGTDGQQRDHATLPPEERCEGDLDGVPRIYRHDTCDIETVMPEEIVRSYLANPFLYNDETFCCGCKAYVRLSRCIWTETGQRLDEYFDDLRRQAAPPSPPPVPRTGRAAVWLAAGAGLCAVSVALDGIIRVVAIGAGVGMLGGGLALLIQGRRKSATGHD